MSIAQKIQTIKHAFPPQTRLVAVSKFHPAEAILEAYDAGQRVFGESKVQELTEKYHILPKDIEWHFIGHLQTNKVKYIAPFICMIHSIDSPKLLEEVNRQVEKSNRTVQVLLQIHIAQETSKFGFSPQECLDFLNTGQWKNFKHIQICGLMGMATFTEDQQQIRGEFQTLNQLFFQIKNIYFAQNENFKELSMGMSDDYQIAIETGSTLVRLGSSIFGGRN